MAVWQLFRKSFGDGLSGSTELRALRYVVIDTELTSLDKRTNRVLSIGAVAMEGSRILLGHHFYREIDPGVPIPEETVVIHGLRPADVQRGESPYQALVDLREFTRGAILVGHFVALDVHALQKELGGKREELANTSIDTARVHRWILRETRLGDDSGHANDDLSLHALATLYEVPVQNLHHALGDAFLTAQLWQKLMSKIEGLGIKTLRQLVRIAG